MLNFEAVTTVVVKPPALPRGDLESNYTITTTPAHDVTRSVSVRGGGGHARSIPHRWNCGIV